MTTIGRQVAVVGLALSVILGVACSNEKNLPRNEQTVTGVTMDLGVLPAELVEGHPTAQGSPGAMHGGTQAYVGSHHIVVALFDAKTGARITDAKISAAVSHRASDHEPDKTLEPMQINGTTTYGGFFAMPDQGLWRIHLRIERPAGAPPIEANFAYEHPGP